MEGVQPNHVAVKFPEVRQQEISMSDITTVPAALANMLTERQLFSEFLETEIAEYNTRGCKISCDLALNLLDPNPDYFAIDLGVENIGDDPDNDLELIQTEIESLLENVRLVRRAFYEFKREREFNPEEPDEGDIEAYVEWERLCDEIGDLPVYLPAEVKPDSLKVALTGAGFCPASGRELRVIELLQIIDRKQFNELWDRSAGVGRTSWTRCHVSITNGIGRDVGCEPASGFPAYAHSHVLLPDGRKVVLYRPNQSGGVFFMREAA
jgi:hypothetical protein